MNSTTISALRTHLASTRSKKNHRLLRAVSGTSRFKVLTILHRSPSGLTPTEIAKVLNVSLSRVSHQLRILRDNRLVVTKNGSREVVYHAVPNRIIRSLVS